jgi:hypothetical protein|tara:strand:- start:199 stop:471 length:273 start_codon:yes stop_codon:yes gene_type:complete
MKDFRDIKKVADQQRFRLKEVYQPGDLVFNTNTGEKGVVHRSGVNYVIAVTEEGKMFRAWVSDIREVQETINKERKSSIFTNNGKAETND